MKSDEIQKEEELERARIRARREEEKNRAGKGCIGCLGFFIILAIIGGIITNLDSNKSSDNKSEQPSTEQIKSKASNEAILLTQLQKSFDGVADVSFSSSKKMFTITPTDSDFKTAILAMLSGTVTKDDWNDMTENIRTMSQAMQEKYGSGYVISVLNPENTENTLLMVKDGNVTYNFADKL